MQLYNNIILCHIPDSYNKCISEIEFDILGVYKYKFNYTFSNVEKPH